MQTRGSADIIFVDISAYQTITDENLLFSKTPAIYLRAFGSNHATVDATFYERAAMAKAHGVPCGAYYFATPTTDPATDGGAEARAQADQFITVLQNAFGTGKYGDLIPMLDCEAWDSTVTPMKPMFYGITGAILLAWIEAFRDHFFARSGRRLGFYSNRYFLTDPTQAAMTTAQITELNNMPLWLAEYDNYYPQNTTDTAAPANLGGWTTYAAWQYLEGVEADQWGLSHFENKVDLNRTDSLDRLLPPPPPTNVNPVQIADNMIEVTFTKPAIMDYLGSSLYVNGVWRKWITAAASSVQLDITGFARNADITVQITAEDTYSDFGRSEVKTLRLFPTAAEADVFYGRTTITEGAEGMPKRTTGITGKSLSSFVVDAGAVYVNYGETDERLLGATRGGNTFTIEVEMREMEIDGIRQAVKGTKRVISVVASLTCNLLELTAENLALSLTGSSLTTFTAEGATAPTHDVIRRTREIGTMDYIKNVAIVGKVNNTNENFIGILYNALSSGGLEIAMEDENEAAIELTFTAHIDADSINDDGSYTEAWEIRKPIVPIA